MKDRIMKKLLLIPLFVFVAVACSDKEDGDTTPPGVLTVNMVTPTNGGGIIATANHIIDFVDDCTILTILSKDTKENKNIKNLVNKKVKQKYFKSNNSINIEKNRFIDKNENYKQFQTSSLDKIELSKKVEKNIINYLKKVPKKF